MCQPGWAFSNAELSDSAQPLGAEPSMSHTVSVPPPLTLGGVDGPAQAGDAAAWEPPEPPEAVFWLEFPLEPQAAAASATVAAQTANRVTRFTVAVLPCPATTWRGLV